MKKVMDKKVNEITICLTFIHECKCSAEIKCLAIFHTHIEFFVVKSELVAHFQAM
jgi:hypothetical protein